MKLYPAANAPAAAQPAPVSVVPFVSGTYEYTEPIASQTVTLGASAQDLNPIQITPGGFLRGLTIIVTSSGGALGTGVLSPDAPFSIFNYITVESIDGTPIIYPMNGYSHYLASRYTRPWDLDPALDGSASYSATINPAFRLFLSTESRSTLGVLPNTDARAQYRLRMALNPLASTNPAGGLLTTAGTATAPAVTVAVALQSYAQPPRASLSGQPVQQVPDGIAAQRFLSNQFDSIGTGTNTVKLNRVGNLIRTLILVVRDSTGTRTDLTTDPVRLRVDNTQLFVTNRNTLDFNMWRWYQAMTAPGVASSTRPTGVYVMQRWQDPGALMGVGWLETSPATFLQWELNGGPSNGSLQQIVEDVALVGPLAPYLENI